jgi:hypothetical protein
MVKLAALSLAAALQAASVLAQRQVDPSLFPGIAPSKDLVWHDCYDVFKCARLIVRNPISTSR